MKYEILAIRDAEPGVNLAEAPACGLLGVVVHPGRRVELVGSAFSVQFTLDPLGTALLVARLGEALASHIAGPLGEPATKAAP